jgi:2-methylisocitrate lyase-like PEP mutase family enzyme
LRQATALPFLLNAPLGKEQELLEAGVHVVLQGHLPYYVMLRALYEAYRHYRAGGTAAELQPRALPADLLAFALREPEHAAWARDYLAPP